MHAYTYIVHYKYYFHVRLDICPIFVITKSPISRRRDQKREKEREDFSYV